jgi:hypothetical protein
MFSVIRRFFLTIVVAQWLYAEAVMLVPSAQPVLDTVTNFLKPPTHDKIIKTYQSMQVERARLANTIQDVSDSTLVKEIGDTVERIRNHDGFGSVR